MVHVLYEGAIFAQQQLGGINRYFMELIDRAPPTVEPRLLTTPIDRLAWPERCASRHQVVGSRPWRRTFRKLWQAATRPQVRAAIRQARPDVVHWTYYRGLCRQPVRSFGPPTVITVYDFIHELFPDLDRKGQHVRWKNQALQQADAVICISQQTQQDLLNRFPAMEDRSTVIPLGNSLDQTSPAPLPAVLRDRPYVLYVGGRKNYKNFETLLRAWRLAQRAKPDLQLAIAGSPLSDDERRRWQLDAGTPGVAEFPLANDSLLAALYSHTAAFVFPSLYEGFGLPAVEAMSFGAPVIASPRGSLAEILGDVGIYFDPLNVGQLTDLLMTAADGFPDRDAIAGRGRSRAANFTWDHTAARTAELYQRLAGCQMRTARAA